MEAIVVITLATVLVVSLLYPRLYTIFKQGYVTPGSEGLGSEGLGSEGLGSIGGGVFKELPEVQTI